MPINIKSTFDALHQKCFLFTFRIDIKKARIIKKQIDDHFTTETARFVFDLVDYAIANNYTRIEFAKQNFTYEEMFAARDFLELTYIINGGYYDEQGIKVVLTKQIYNKGRKFYFDLITLTGLENFDTDKFCQGIEDGKHIVDKMPENYGELEKVTYLYSYLP